MSRYQPPPPHSAHNSHREPSQQRSTTKLPSTSNDGESSNQFPQCDSLRRNYRPLPPCQEILSVAASNVKSIVSATSKSKPAASDEQEDVAANSVRLVSRFITEPNPIDRNNNSSRHKSSSVHRHNKSSSTKLSPKPAAAEHPTTNSNVKRSPKRHTVALTKQSRNVTESLPKSSLEQIATTAKSAAATLHNKSSTTNARDTSARLNPSRTENFNDFALARGVIHNQTFPTEASFLLAEETALLTSSSANETIHSSSANPLGNTAHQPISNPRNKTPTHRALRHQCVDINQLSQLQPPTPTQTHRISPARSIASSSSLLLQQLATPSSRPRDTTTPSPLLHQHHHIGVDGVDGVDDEDTLSSSDFTNFGGETSTVYSTSEYDDEVELDDGQQARKLLDYEYYLQQHAAALSEHQQEQQQLQQQQNNENYEFAPNISVLAQQHDRRIITQQQTTFSSRAGDAHGDELQPYEASFQQLLGAFESELLQHQSLNNAHQRQTFVAMDGKTHILEQTRQQHSSLPSGMMSVEIAEIQQPTRTGDRHLSVQQLRSSSFPTQQNNHYHQSGIAVAMQQNNDNSAVAVSGADTVDGQSLQQNITTSMMNIESRLQRLNQAGGGGVAGGPSAHIVTDDQNFPPNTQNATSQSWAAGQQPMSNSVILGPHISSSTHQEYPHSAARNRPYNTALWSRMLSSCHQALLYPKKPAGPALTGAPPQILLAAAQAQPALPPVDPWEIPFDAIKSLEWKGAGAQGAVFVGTLAGQRVAVKKVCTRREVDEIRPFRRLQHANIIRLLGVCTQELCYSIVMEYCQFGSLYDHIQQHNRILPVQLLSWTKQIAAGMHYLHTNKIIHRDLKSPNVLLSDNQTVKISDFGTSKFAASSSTSLSQDEPAAGDGSGKKSPTTTIAANAVANKTWSFVGTVSWMAPEVIRSEAQNEKVDTWAFGVILWEMLFGLPPYPGVEDASAIMWGVGSEILTLPIPDNVPQGLRLLMLQCWSSKPRNRPTFKNIQIHLDIAAPDVLEMQPAHSGEGGDPQQMATAVSAYAARQDKWREQIMTMLHKEVDSALKHSPRVLKAQELAILEQRKKELRHAQDIRMHYERKLERANNLYLEMTTCMLQLEQRERELIKREQRLSAFLNKDGRPKLAKRRILKAMLGSNGSPSGGEVAYHAPSSAYRWAASAHTTPVSHRLHTHHEYSLDAATSATTGTAGGTTSNMSISLDRGITQSSAVSTHHAMMAVVGPHNTMPALLGGDSNGVVTTMLKNSGSKTIVERTIVKSKHRIPKSTAGQQEQVSAAYVSAKRVQTKYNNNAPPDALFDDRPFRRSKRSIRGSASSSASSNAALGTHGAPTGTHVRRRRRHAMNSGTAPTMGDEQNGSVIVGGKIAEISPDLFKGLPRQRQAASMIVAGGCSTRFSADIGIQCRLVGAPLTVLSTSSSSGRAMASVYSSTTTSPSDSSNNKAADGGRTPDVEVQLNAQMISEVEEGDDEDVEYDGQYGNEKRKQPQRMSRKNQSDTFEINDKSGDDVRRAATPAAAVDEVDCIVPDIDENDVGDDDDDDNLSDREHQVSVMRQRLSSGQVHLTLSSSSSSSSLSAESTESEEAASDATVSLSGPSIGNLEAYCSLKTANPAAPDGVPGTSTAERLPRTTADNSRTIRKTTLAAPTATSEPPIALTGKPAGNPAIESESKIPPPNFPQHQRDKSRSPVPPHARKYPDERPSGMIASDPARAATKLRSVIATSSTAVTSVPK